MRERYNNEEWTKARFFSFVKSILRSGSQRWGPKYTVLSKACVGQKINPKSGRLAKFYLCNMCKNEFTNKDVQVNHKTPVVPLTGFDSWDALIERLFCEEDGLEVLCIPCHKGVTKLENQERKSNDPI